MSTASTDDDEMVHLGAEVPPELKKRVRIAAAKRDKTMSAYLRDLLEDETAHE